MDTQNSYKKALRREILRQTERLSRYDSHRNFLQECLKGSVISEGFMLKWNPCIEVNNEILMKYDAILKNAGLQLMEITCEALGNITRELNFTIQRKLSDTTLINDNFKNDVNIAYNNHSKKYCKIKKKKRKRNDLHSEKRQAGSIVRDNDEMLTEQYPIKRNVCKDLNITLNDSLINSSDQTAVKDLHGNIVLKVKGDGNCFYRCISAFATG